MSKNKAFTLMELLVVIGIIAILMGLLFPVINAAKEQGKKTRARSEVKQIETAWKSLLLDCRTWPPQAVQGGWPTVMDKARVDCLVSNNPQKIAYLEINKKSMYISKMGGNPMDGGMKDPWSTEADPRLYKVVLDNDYDNSIAITRGTGIKKTNETVFRAVAIWSDGGRKDDPSDDILAW